MPIDKWLERKGQPEGDDTWLQEQRTREQTLAAPQTQKRPSAAPTGTGLRSTEPETIDLTGGAGAC